MANQPDKSVQRFKANDASFEILVADEDLLTLVGVGKPYQILGDARCALRDVLVGLDDPIHAAVTPRGLTVLLRNDQYDSTLTAVATFGLNPESIRPSVLSAEGGTRQTIERTLMRRLRLTWDAPHSFDFYENGDGHLTGVLTIKKSNGNQTKKIEFREGVSIDDIEQAWTTQERKWKFNEVPVEKKDENIFFHVRYIQPPNGQCIVWTIRHKNDVPDDDCFVVENVAQVPTVAQAYADDPDYKRITEKKAAQV